MKRKSKMRVSYRELLSVEMKQTNRLNMISELRTERVYTSRLRQDLTLVINVKVYRQSRLVLLEANNVSCLRN